jgi:hypothetical protein
MERKRGYCMNHFGEKIYWKVATWKTDEKKFIYLDGKDQAKYTITSNYGHSN